VGLRSVEEAQQRLKLGVCDPRNLDGGFIGATLQLLLPVHFYELWGARGEHIRKDAGFGAEVVSVDTVQYPVNLAFRNA